MISGEKIQSDFTSERQTKPGIPLFLSPEHWRVEPGKPGDVEFIIDSWCADESVRVGRQSGEDPEIFKIGMRTRILRLLSGCPCAVVRPTAKYFVDTGTPADSRKLFGWVCYTQDRATLRPIIHFVYVRTHDPATEVKCRKRGLATALLYMAAGIRPEKGAWCTHNRPHLARARDARGIVYNRFLLDYDPASPPPYQDPYRGKRA